MMQSNFLCGYRTISLAKRVKKLQNDINPVGVTSFPWEWRHSRGSDVIQNINNRVRTFLGCSSTIMPSLKSTGRMVFTMTSLPVLWRHTFFISIGPCYSLVITLSMCKVSWISDNSPAQESKKGVKTALWRHFRFNDVTHFFQKARVISWVLLWVHANFHGNQTMSLPMRAKKRCQTAHWRHSRGTDVIQNIDYSLKSLLEWTSLIIPSLKSISWVFW